MTVEAPVELTDQALVQSCLGGDQQSWGLLIDRYKNLIYSFSRRYGAGPSDAADIFQLVCTELFAALPRLRNGQSVCAWIMTVAAHESLRWKRRHLKRVVREESLDDVSPSEQPTVAEAVEHAERGRLVREALATLPPRCQEMMRLLFFEEPPAPYSVVAERLGLATGSIGLTRSRCLRRLEEALLQVGMGGNGTNGQRLKAQRKDGPCESCSLAQPLVVIERQAARPSGDGARKL